MPNITKQKQIEELRESKERLQDRVDGLEAWNTRMKKIFWGDRYYDKTTEELYIAIQDLDKKVLREGQEISSTIDHLSSENSKLWYLIRAITGDATLKGEKEGEVSNHQEINRMANTPFRKPRF
jgi:hypothetical protein